MVNPEVAVAPGDDPAEVSWKLKADRSPLLRLFLVISFFVVFIFLAMNSVGAEQNTDYGKSLIPFCVGIFVTILVTFSVLRKTTPLSNKRILLIWGALLVHLLIVQGLVYLCTKRLETGDQFLLLILPYVFAPMIITVLLGRRMGIFTTLAVSFFSTSLVPLEDMNAVLVISLIAGSITVLATHQTRSRSQLLRAGCYVGLSVLIMGLLYGKVGVFDAESLSNWKILVGEGVSAFATSVFLSILLSGIFPVLESMFSITTATGWLERCDLNEKLMGRLQMEAPGTFHHSLMVAQLAEAAAEAIGANALECRVCSYYHDIGKLSKPEYFTENMPDKANSPHNVLTPLMSAKILMKHVEDGVVLAKKHKLERHIVATIREHHGTSTVSFLYQKALDIRDEMLEKVKKGLANSEDVVYPDESQYHYLGPIPQSRESGIVSLADAVESASRSLNHPTVEEIQELIDRIIRYRVNEGQLDDSRLSLGDLKKIRQSFISMVKNMLHSRISYPKSATESEERKPLSISVPAAEEDLEKELDQKESIESGESSAKSTTNEDKGNQDNGKPESGEEAASPEKKDGKQV